MEEDYTQRPLGVIPSPHDPKDYPYWRVMALPEVYPDEFHLATPADFPTLPMGVSYDQNGFGMCYAYSLAYGKMVQEYNERRIWTLYAPAYPYGRRSPLDYTGEGMEPREANQGVLDRGMPQFEHLPFQGTYQMCADEIARLGKERLDELAAPQKIGAYVRISTVQEVKATLMTLGTPVMFCIPVYDSFYQGGDLPIPDKSKERLHGYHGTVLDKWDDDYLEGRFFCKNSWGDWGPMHGAFTVPYNYPVMEMWALTDRHPSSPSIRLKIGSEVFLIGDNPHQFDPDCAPLIKNERTFVEIRRFAEAQGWAVEWTQKNGFPDEVVLTPPLG